MAVALSSKICGHTKISGSKTLTNPILDNQNSKQVNSQDKLPKIVLALMSAQLLTSLHVFEKPAKAGGNAGVQNGSSVVVKAGGNAVCGRGLR